MPKRRIAAVEILRRWPHEIQLLRGIGNIPRDVAKLRARNVTALEILPPRLYHIGDLRIGNQMRRAIQHGDIMQMLGEPLGLDQVFRLNETGHCQCTNSASICSTRSIFIVTPSPFKYIVDAAIDRIDLSGYFPGSSDARNSAMVSDVLRFDQTLAGESPASLSKGGIAGHQFGPRARSS